MSDVRHSRATNDPGFNVQPTKATGWVGWIFFSGILMVMLGAFHAIMGFVALFKDEYYLVGRNGLVLSLDYTQWGWVHIIIGLVALAAGFGVLVGQMWARVVGIILALVSAVGNLVFIASHPIWSTMVIALDVLIIDEADKIRDDCWDQYLAPRTVDRDGRVLLISTPGSVNSWFFKQFRRAKNDAAYQSFSMPTGTNPHISPAVIEAERTRLQPDDFRSQYGAEFIGLDLTPCNSCGGPDVYARGGVTLHGAEKLRFCPDCGLIVHEDGKTAVAIEGRSGEDHLRCSVMVFVDDTTDENMEFPDYCQRVLFIDPRPMENPQELPPGCE